MDNPSQSGSKRTHGGGGGSTPNANLVLNSKNKSDSLKSSKPKPGEKDQLDYIKSTEQFNMNYDDLISSLTEKKSQTPCTILSKTVKTKIVSHFKFDEETKEKSSKVGGAKSPERYDFSQSMKVGKSKGPEEVKSLITQCGKKENINDKEIKNVSDLTNTQDIKDFYQYTKECLRRFSKISQPTQEELEKIYIDSFPFDEELENKKLAVFDLDETLVHCLTKNINKAHIQLNISSFNSKIGINIRPFWKEALNQIKNNYVIIVYTASHKNYADEVLNYLDPKNEIFSYRLYRHNCVRVKMENEQIYVKDLRLFKNIDLNKIIIIDNSALSFAFHLDNGIPILPYYDNKDDVELMTLVNYLNCIAKVDDLRTENRKYLKMQFFLKKACEQGDDESEMLDESVNENDGSFVTSETGVNGLLVLNPCKTESPNISIDHNYNTNDSAKILKHKSTKNFQELLFQSLEDFSKHFKKK